MSSGIGGVTSCGWNLNSEITFIDFARCDCDVNIIGVRCGIDDGLGGC